MIAVSYEAKLIQLGGRLRNRLRREKHRKLGVRNRLRPEWEMDNFSYSHLCTSDVRLWSGARWCSSTGASRFFTCFSFSFSS